MEAPAPQDTSSGFLGEELGAERSRSYELREREGVSVRSSFESLYFINKTRSFRDHLSG